ncbi:SUN domain-containing ossification factor isoform X2 [Drosophila virilis]|uniref:Uncharacterized protein, isoform D n=1 Tax=Drosophila virilis TaxID=7244 RepID=B4LV97_DROVI|nr:SUN domain-containing ossification factor isoform X2 [Drosophila virilis]EDW64357.2 uncharacterized protein Dvir_GJ17429, isoform D [Drosophila virilis]
MKIRLHLVRFMYINLILSCCFWLYDNAAAADVSSANAATAENANRAVHQADARMQIPLAALAPASENEGTFAMPLTKFKTVTNVAKEDAPPTATTTASTSTTTSSSPQQEEDNIVMKLGSAPSSSAEAISDAVIDTVVPNNEKSNSAEETATAKVPKNQLNKINNININDNIDVNQVDKLQQPNQGGVAPKPIPAPEHQRKQSLPEIITELPAVTVAELPLEVEHVKDRLESVLPHEAAHSSGNKTESQQPPSQAFEIAKEAAQKAELNINDPGGGLELHAFASSESNATVDGNVTSEGGQIANAAAAASSNETVEEVPMPVFSEWAQKQIEAEASREQAMELEQQVVNNSAQRRNATGSGSGKPPSLKLRAKNYASPDCGAKIIASNADATNTGAVLSHSSDEYMLSTCGSRIWFVVELCEAVQAQKVELANFELFSSSPKNFTVAVSKRFPTRDWSNVGRFVAEDKRTVQTFELHPHLFGKFVRVDIHSHYSKEHFCPISLFRVFGTSEFEAFETEIRHSDELDDFDDDFGGQEQLHKTLSGTDGGGANIFQSASDAVIQMVKKAAQVLVKPSKPLRWSTDSLLCFTPTAGLYSCQSCNSSAVDRINNLLSCQSHQLQQLLLLPQLRTHLLQSRVCQADYNISLASLLFREEERATSGMDKRQSFYLSMLPAEHVGAMCKLLQAEHSSVVEYPVELPEAERQRNLDVAQHLYENLTIADSSKEPKSEAKVTAPNDSLPAVTPTLEVVSAEMSTASEKSATDAPLDPQPTDSSTIAATPSDVNIFNVPTDTQKNPTQGSVPIVPDTPTATPASQVDPNEVEASKTPTGPTTSHPPTSSSESDSADLLGSGNGLDDSNLSNWESIDSLLTTTVASITAGGGAAAAAAAVVNGNANIGGTANAGNAGSLNLQPKLTHGPQSESVFIRLSNRIKALERNMSLSGQYLEELSRRYKKQVEELQQTLTQQSLTVRTLEDQSRRFIDQEQLYKQQSAELAGEVRALTYQVQACILVIIIVGTCIFLMLVLGTVYYRKLRRQTQQLLPQATTDNSQQKLSRRKSYEQMTQQSPGKQRRPSEEAMLILNGCGDSSLTVQSDAGNGNGRQRKISVCYGSNNNIANHMSNTRPSLHRRKGAKHSWHASLDSAQVTCGENPDKFFDVDTLKSNKMQNKSAKRKSLQQFQQELKRQESAPASYTENSLTEEPTQSDFDESLILDDEDLCNFIPNTDLAYNEFMPEGPSGYQILDTVDGKADKGQTVKKCRRVSSPAFFKSPFSKNKNKGGSLNGMGGVKGSQSAHEATSWEWYRLRRSEKQSKQLSVPSVSISSTPNASLDNSSLSEINFPFNSTQNSFRILGEAILSSGESRPSGKDSAVAAGSSSSSGASTTSSTTKKKQRAFNNIFRKVF